MERGLVRSCQQSHDERAFVGRRARRRDAGGLRGTRDFCVPAARNAAEAQLDRGLSRALWCRLCVTCFVALSERHRAILEAIGLQGATEESLGSDARSRELGELARDGLIVFWHPGRFGPPSGIVGGNPGRWCLTFKGADEADLPPLRLA